MNTTDQEVRWAFANAITRFRKSESNDTYQVVREHFAQLARQLTAQEGLAESIVTEALTDVWDSLHSDDCQILEFIDTEVEDALVHQWEQHARYGIPRWNASRQDDRTKVVVTLDQQRAQYIDAVRRNAATLDSLQGDIARQTSKTR